MPGIGGYSSRRRTSPRKKTTTAAVEPGSATGSGDVSSGTRNAELGLAMRNKPVREPTAAGDDHSSEDSEDELPDLATLMGGPQTTSLGIRSRNPMKRREALLSPSQDSRSNANSANTRSTNQRLRTFESQDPDFSTSSSSSFRQPASAANLNSATGLLLTPSLPLPRDELFLPPPPQKGREDGMETTTMTTTRSSRQQIQRHRSPVKARDSVSPIKQNSTSTLSPTKKINIRLEAETQSTYPRNRNRNANQTPLEITHANSLLLPLKELALRSDEESEKGRSGKTKASKAMSRRGLESLPTSRTAREGSAMFVLEEAVCKDDDDEDREDDEEEEEELTDLSGFVVDDDDAEISFCDSKDGDGSDAGEEVQRDSRKKSPIKRRLVRGTKEARRSLSDELQSLKLEDDEGYKSTSKKGRVSTESLAKAIAGMSLGVEDRKPDLSRRARTGEVEVVDLTTSPVKPQAENFPAEDSGMPKRKRHVQLASQRNAAGIQKDRSDSDSSTDRRDALLRFSPPSRKSPFKIKGKIPIIPLDETNLNSPRNAEPFTPPQTPPASPSKLQSPSKLKSPSKNLLLSPGKRGVQIPQSPHRQSIDAFWSSEITNEWNDQYSPKKPPLTISPKKRWKIWEDESDSGSESPCESPARRVAKPERRTASPLTKTAAGDRKAAATAKKRFDQGKFGMAHDLLRELDGKVSNGKLAQLSQGTGGVKIIWSKNLRSTAGRANWRRTVTKTSTDSPVKEDRNPGRMIAEAGDVKIQHYASIELAEKVIDNEERLVNTLAHEYCHLANFMVSGIRDQPHGASFKHWAQKVTSTFRTHPKEIYRQVEVTTKHSYEINHKYLWVCVGTPPNAAKDFLNLPDDDGCGAEYGRHSKSIDPERHRCGKCKGVLVQVRPRPRKADLSKKAMNSFKKKGDALEDLEEAMELVTIDED